jgi:hypothetical protein
MATQKKATVTNASNTNGNSEPKPDKPHGKEHPCRATAYRESESPEIRTASQLPGRPLLGCNTWMAVINFYGIYRRYTYYKPGCY